MASGTGAGTAVIGQPFGQGPAGVDVAGGLSSYGTMGQGGNVWEWNESAIDGSNSSSSEDRANRGGFWNDGEGDLRSSTRFGSDPAGEIGNVGFRVASVPEPSTYALVLMAGGAWLLRKRLRRSL